MPAFNGNTIFVTGEFQAAGTAQTVFIPVRDDMEGEVTEVATVLGGSISGSDETITVSKNTSSMGTITIANSSSAAGDLDTLNPTSSNRHLVAGDYLKVDNAGDSTGTDPIGFTVTIKR